MASKSFSKLIPCFSIARSHSFIERIRPLASTTEYLFRRKISNHHFVVRSFSSRPTTSSLNDPSPNWSNRPPKETILLEGCDFEHWLCVVETPDPNFTRDQLIDHYIKILAKVVGSEEEARMKIYSVSTKHYFAFGANVSEDLSYKLKELPELRWVLPDSYLDVKNKDYGGEPFINGEAVPYDPKYHEEWVRNNARANERSRRNDRPRNFDRSRNFERRGEMRSGGGTTPMNQANQGNPTPNSPPPSPHNATQSPPPPMQNPNFNRPLPSQGPPTPNVGYQNQIPQPGYQGGGGGYQSGNPGYHPSPNPNMPQPPQYAAQSQTPQNPNFNRPTPPPAHNYYQGGAPAYQSGAPAYQSGAPGYQSGAPGYQSGAPGYQQGSAPAYQQSGAPGYQSNAGGYSNYQGNPNSNPAQSGGGAYPGGYQGGNVQSQGPDMPTGGDKGY